jgi:uncharacterized protein YbjT (DUF2867 family)
LQPDQKEQKGQGAAKKVGLEKFVMLSSMEADDRADSNDFKVYLKAKHNADDSLKASALNYSIVRPIRITDDDVSGEIELKEKLEKSGNISKKGVDKILVKALEDDERQIQIFEILSGETQIEKVLRS